jgi:hypothetical protein
MFYKIYFHRIAVALLFTSLSAAARAAGPDPLFAAETVLDVRISAPFKQLMQERPEEDELPGTFTFVAGENSRLELDIALRTRGNYRRRKTTCEFAPLRINFRKSQLEDTVLAGQDKLKLVTHCDNNSGNYQQAVLREYIAYRILNVLTDFSYRVRLLRVTYVYADDDNAERPSYAFFIESDDRLAKRVDLRQQEVPAVSLVELQADYTNLTSVFQYLIGNLDFSPIKGVEGDDCCHNNALFSDEHDVYWPIPYDFDLSGLVDAAHNAPNLRLGQLNVRQRVYRGRCINNQLLPATLQLFRDRRAAIEALIEGQAELDKGSRRSLDSYVASFYKKIDNKRTLGQLTKACI